MTEIDAPEEMSRISRCLWAYEELNINVDDTRVINRSIVLPQGSELAPLLFSFYIDEIGGGNKYLRNVNFKELKMYKTLFMLITAVVDHKSRGE